MGEEQERAAFERRHAAEPIEITVLTGEHTGGAGKAGGELLWTASAPTIAHVDEAGNIVVAPGSVDWLATDDDRDTWIHDLKPFTQYRLRVRRATPDPAEYTRFNLPVPDLSSHFGLDEVLERDVHVPALDERLAQWRRPVVLATALGDFTLNRTFGHFEGEVGWVDGRAEVTLDVDEDSVEGSETCRATLARLEQLVAGLPDVDARWRAYAADRLTDLANDWQESDDDAADSPPITPEAFARRITLESLTVSADGSLTPYYADGDLFWGHVILIDVTADDELTDAYIAG